MKNFWMFLFLCSHAHSASIDTALFKGDKPDIYYQKIEKNINTSMMQKLKSKETIKLEKSTLQKLQELYAIKDEVPNFQTIKLDSPVITQKNYVKALLLLSDLKTEINRLSSKEKSIQQKLFQLKSIIEKTLSSEANQSLLNNQLLYAFYKITQDKIHQSLGTYKQLFKQEFKGFQEALPRVSFTTHNVQKSIQHNAKKIDAIKHKSLLLSIDKDSEAQRDTKAKKEIVNKEKSIQKETDSVLIKKLKSQIILSLIHLKSKDEKAFLESTKHIQEDFATLSEEEKVKYDTLFSLLLTFGENHFQDSSVALAAGELGLEHLKNSLISLLTKTLFVYEEKAFSIKTILLFAFIIMIGSIIAKVYKNIVDRFRKTNRIKSLSTARLIANSGYYLIIVSTFFIALGTIGLDMHTIFVIIGAVLLWLALGLQGFISNYAMGILIKIDRSIRIGDHVELDNHIVGTVDDMDFRSITIQTSDQVRITIPNSRFIAGSFINHSFEGKVRRIHIPFSAPNIHTKDEIEKIVLLGLQQNDLRHLGVTKSQVILTDINRAISRYSLLVWIQQQKSYDASLVRSSFLTIIQKSLHSLSV